MKFVLGFAVGLAITAAIVFVIRSRRPKDDEVVWAGDDTSPPALPQDDGMSASAASST